MQPEHLIFGGGSADTVLHPFVAGWILIAIVLILALPRDKAIAPFLLAFFFTPIGQVLVLAGVHLTMHQVLVLVVLGRVVAFRKASGERFAGGFNALDRVVVLWAISAFVIVSLQWMQLQPFIKFIGDFIVSLGGYLAVRFLVPDRNAVRRMVKVLALVFVIQGACMISEQFTCQNVFAFAGAKAPAIRDGHIRSEGPVGGLYAGTFAGVSIPLFVWLWTESKSRIAACAGFVGATSMVFTSHASTTWMAYGAALFGLAFWPLRRQMRLIRLGLVCVLIGLHLVMHGPVWSLIEKIDLTGGSSSYHRYILVDNCIRHFSDWWLIGCTDYPSWGFDMWDLCNQFVAVAFGGGLVSLVLFITIYSRGFGAIGSARKLVEGCREKEWLLWCLGATLFANVVASFGINYMVHLELALFSILACVCVVTFGAGQVAVSDLDSARNTVFAPTPRPASAWLAIRGVR